MRECLLQYLRMITQSASVDVSQAALDWLDYLSGHVDPVAVPNVVSSGSKDPGAMGVSLISVVRVEYQDELVGCIAHAGLDRCHIEGEWIGSGHPLTVGFESLAGSGNETVVSCQVRGGASYLARVIRFSNGIMAVERL